LGAILGAGTLAEIQRERQTIHKILDRTDLPIHLWESARTVEDVVAMTLRMSHLGVKVVFIDYLQLLRTRRNIRSMVEMVSEISRALKGVAKPANVAIVALSQLSRQSERREDKRPRLSDLRESGALEQDADTVILLHRDKEEEPYTLEIDVAKNRHGPIGTTTAYFDLEMQYVQPPNIINLEDLNDTHQD